MRRGSARRHRVSVKRLAPFDVHHTPDRPQASCRFVMSHALASFVRKAHFRGVDMNMWDAIGLWVTSAIVAVPLVVWAGGIAWRWLRNASSHIADKIEQRRPGSTYSWPLRILYLAFVGLFALVLYFPSWVPWATIADPTEAVEVSPLPLLGAAAGLIALLVFAASHMRDTEKDARSGDSYLGRHLGSYMTLRSWWVRVLSAPLLTVAVLILFVVPLVINALPGEVVTHASSYLPWAHFSPHQLAAALWCSAFGTTGAVLLLNLLTVLQNAPALALYPWWIRRQIEGDLRRDAMRSFGHIYQMRAIDQRGEAQGWASQRVAKAAALPSNEQVKYLHLTLGAILLNQLVWKDEERVQQLARRARLHTSARRKPRSGAARWVYDMAAQRSESRYEHALRRHHAIQLGLMSGIAEALPGPELAIGARRWLEGYALRASSSTDTLFTALVANEVDPTTRSNVASTALEIMLEDPRELDRWVGRHRGLLAWHDDREPKILTLCGLVFKMITPMIIGEESQERDLRPRDVDDLLSSATALKHAETHAFVLRLVGDAAVRLATGSDSEDAKQVRRQLVGRLPSTRGSDDDEASSPLSKTIESVAFEQLVFGGAQAPSKIAALLELVRGWHAPAALLHRLYYGNRSHDPLTVESQHAFAWALRSLRETSSGPLPARDNAVTRFLIGSGYIGHFVHPDGVRWLMAARREPLTLRLCADFLEKSKKRLFSDFYFTDFLAWHCLSARDTYYDHFDSTASVEDARTVSELMPERERLERLAEEWAPLDSRVTRRVHALLSQIPSS